jgi:hypothetical protein
VTWYEPNAARNWPTNIFASRFDAATNTWLPSGQRRANIPSLNVNVLRTAENPSVAGGAAVAGNDPVPWITWEENDGVPDDQTRRRQIFVVKGIKQAAPDTMCPPGTKPGGGLNENGICWQLVGLGRIDASAPVANAEGAPTLNVDPSRSGEEPDIAFTGPGDTVAWVVWYEEDDTSISGLRSNDMVFASKIVADATALGGFHWVAVGNGTAGQTNILDTSGTNQFGGCAESGAAEDACSLNAVAGHDAENPRVAAGTLMPGGTTVPWVVWQEDTGEGRHAVFVSRLVGGNHFELFNGGQPVSNTANDATRPDITFSGNVPYISWQEDIAGTQVAFVGHFEGAVFKLDTPSGQSGSGFGQDSKALRAPISSGCTANPFNADGASCQGGAIGTPFMLFTAGDQGAQHLFAQAFAPSDVTTLPATDVSEAGATLEGSVNPGGAAIRTHFDFGPTPGFASTTAEESLGASTVATPLDAVIDLAGQTGTFHFRAVARTDFVTVPGADQTFTVENTPPTVTIDDLPDKVNRRALGRARELTVDLTVSEAATVTVDVLGKRGNVIREVTVMQASAGSFPVTISLKGARGRLTLRVTAIDAGGASGIAEQAFKAQ